MKFPEHKILTKICPAGQTEGRTDRRTDVTKITVFTQLLYQLLHIYKIYKISLTH